MTEILKIARGDTIPTRRQMAAVIDNLIQDMSTGWQCHTAVLSYPDRAVVVAERQITEITNQRFQVYLTHAESLQLAVADPTKPAHYIWTIQISNGAEHYKETDIDLIVREAGVTA